MEKIIEFENPAKLRAVFGIEDGNIKLLESTFSVAISLKSQGLAVKGQTANVAKAVDFINRISGLEKEGFSFDQATLTRYLNSQENSSETKKRGIKVFSNRRKFVYFETSGQEEYAEAMAHYDIVFATGPAGTGKTYLAMAQAVNALIEKKVRRIILTRPAIEAGESLGFLPGDMLDKLGPYLRPLYDALYDMLEADAIEDYLETGSIEIAPLAYMRGRTLNDAFIILDEAQNCTSEQLRMFLTRLGFDSKTVITGDPTQSDLPEGKPTGLLDAMKVLKPIKGIKFVNLSKKDVVRHPLIQKIIQAYEDFYKEKEL